ncbi:aminopeptidase P family protein [Kineosporia rhizophila]|uniref:aminopeptidase P family protein n=1 Tax=Kineosporia TaxID=49184 RepID=UPI001E643384|nr:MULTISPECIES: aminopeptidase P family protein [Kineosporia]MCE0534927.1 aminopeptidase P family protein [Kineosporia rhizophila]GLY14792.1 Xaa-Pro aminopeptidase [Kineosporia sp. NBRC 101677]
MSENEPVVQGPEGESAKPQEVEHRERPNSPAFRAFIASGWAPRPSELPARLPAAAYAAERRARLAAELPGERLVLPAGVFRVRSNDTDHRFRPHSAFAHLTGLGTDREPDAALVIEPTAEGFEAVLYVQPRAERDSEQFYADPRYGELWVGVRPSLEEVEAETGLTCRPLADLREAVTKDVGAVPVRVLREADPGLDEALAEAREAAGVDAAEALTADHDLARIVSELRLVKDEFEVAEMRRAVDATALGFADIVRALPEAVASVRGERVVETVFESRARREGNGVGYDTIAASGPHACTLHWIRNDGPVHENDLVLVDAGVEVDTLYTADVTRTLPVSGKFTEPQRRVYQAVLDAADAAFAAARPGVKFREVHAAAMQVIARTLAEWDLLPGTAEESLGKEGQFHRRWMVHGTSHHLGIDVHDCAQARKEMYLDAELQPGMVFTIEPGLYFGPHDLLAPEELRGIGVRIEDDVLVTADGVENLSAGLPRRPDEIEAWMASLRD